jgi:protein-S-isoprenylcysteine O-methyltransferase Ste14
VNLRRLVGSGDKIALATAPFLLAGVALNIAYPGAFSVGGPPVPVLVVCAIVLVAGVTVWLWSAALIVTQVPSGKLITSGPYCVVCHPLYTGVALLVLPWAGFAANTWLGALAGIVMYSMARSFAPAEEAALAKAFGAAWQRYTRTVKIPWI